MLRPEAVFAFMPAGQSTLTDDAASRLKGRPSGWSECNSRMRWGFDQLRGLAPAGRLDIVSIGLLVLTQDGRVARQLIGEDSGIEKEYLVRVSLGVGGESSNVQAVFAADKLALLRHGLSLDGQPLRPRRSAGKTPSSCVLCSRKAKNARSDACASRSACTSQV